MHRIKERGFKILNHNTHRNTHQKTRRYSKCPEQEGTLKSHTNSKDDEMIG